MILRNEYLYKLIKFKDIDLIKVVTGIRRCGKSTLFELFINYLKENGIDEDHIIQINLEDVEFHDILDDYVKLYKKVMEQIKDNFPKYILTMDAEAETTYDGIIKLNALDK